MCPICAESIKLGQGNFKFIDRIGYTNCLEISIPSVCRSCGKPVVFDKLEVRSVNPQKILRKGRISP